MPLRDSISLYCTKGTSDKVYHIQLEENVLGGWDVHSQYGPRKGGRTSVIKAVAVSFTEAKKVYDDTVSEKFGKSYVSGVLAGKSVFSSAPLKIKTKLPPLPGWTGFDEIYSEVATALGVASTLSTSPDAYLVLLADIASCSQDGLPDAVTSVNSCAGNVEIKRLLSNDATDWFDKFSAAAQNMTLMELSDACESLA